MPQSLSLAIGFSLTSLIFSNSANAFKASQAWTWTAPPVDWNDFHVQIKTDTEILGPSILYAGSVGGGIINIASICPGPVVNPPPPEPNFPEGMDHQHFMNCNSVGLAGKTLYLGVEYDLKKENRLKPVDPYYTNNGIRVNMGPTVGGNPIFVGFDVSNRNSPSVDLTLFNSSTEEALNISNLSWSYKPEKTLLGELLPFTLSGFTPISGTFQIPINGSISFNLDNLPQDPGYILFQGTSVGQISGFSSDFIGEHEEVPEPLTILGSATALGFGAFFKRKLKSSESSEKETINVG
jgi:hypothetical protein